MISILYTNSDKVLSTLGLSSDDLADSFFTARELNRTLSVILYTWLPDHDAVYYAENASTTAKQRYDSDCLILFCTHFCAAKVAEAVLGIMLKETDGENAYDRFSSIDFKQLAKDQMTQAEFYKQSLLVSLQSTNAAPEASQLSVITPSYDPVAG